MPPEIHEKNEYNPLDMDLFASGIILFLMTVGHPPFKRAAVHDPHYKLLAMKKFSFWQEHTRNNNDLKNLFRKDFRDLIFKMLAYQKDDRLDFDELR